MTSETSGMLSGLSVVLPAYNEAGNIEAMVRDVESVAASYAGSHEILVVDDGSIDSTPLILDDLRRELRSLRVVTHEVNRGYGGALLSGFSAASKDFVFFTDADRQFDLKEISRLIRWIDEYDIVTGYREARSDSLHRKVNAYAWTALVRLLLGIRVRDVDCAFKLFRREVLNRLTLTANGAMINAELLARARKCNLRVKEVPVSHFPRVVGVQSGANPRVVVRAFLELTTMYRKLR